MMSTFGTIKITNAQEEESLIGTKDVNTVVLPNPLDPNNLQPNMTFNDLIGRIITGALGIVGSLTLLMFIYGGFLWLTSAGDGKKIQQGKDILLWSTVGLAIIFSSYALVKFVITSIGG